MTKRRSQTRKTDYTRWRGAERSHGEWNFSNRAQTPRKREREEISVTPERELRGQETGRGKRSFTTIFGVSLSLCLSHFSFSLRRRDFIKRNTGACARKEEKERKRERDRKKERGEREKTRWSVGRLVATRNLWHLSACAREWKNSATTSFSSSPTSSFLRW